MRLLPRSKPESMPSQRGGRQYTVASPLLAALAFSLLGFLAVGLAGAGPATAANPTATAKHTATAKPAATARHTATPEPTAPPEPTPVPEPTMSPFISGRHVYDNGNILSANSVKLAETLATQIEAAGGGRIVIYTAPENGDLPDQSKLAAEWHVDGLLLTGQGQDGRLTMGATLKAKLSSDQSQFLTDNSSNSQATAESWIMSTLARVDAFVSGTHVFDGTGTLDAGGMQQAETAAKNLGSQLGATVYIDIAIGGSSPSSTAFFNGTAISDAFGTKTLVIALAVSDGQIGGDIDSSSDLWDSYQTNSPWSSDTLESEKAANGDVQGALLAAINAVQKPPLVSGDMIPIIGFVVVMVVFGVSSIWWGGWLITKMTGTGAVKGGLPGDAVIESITDTGTTVSMSGVGAYAPEYKFGLLVTPAAGGTPYQTQAKALVPRVYIPMVVPGVHVGVLIDPKNPMKVSVDFSRMGGATPDFAAAGAAGAAGSGGMDINFDASGQPAAGDVAAFMGAVRGGSLPTIKGSADHILATGTHGTAVITTAQPMGRTVRQIDPSADPSRLNDPIWLFTVEVTLAGQAPFPAVFGHRVPVDKVASVAPGVKLAVAVDESNKNQDVAIDWDKSPLT